jgi:hypothetical protein
MYMVNSSTYQTELLTAQAVYHLVGYKASRSGPNLNYFVFSVINLTVKYPENALKTGPTGIFFGG